MAEINAKLSFNTEQMLKVLGAALYKGDICTTAVRELVQNSLDAIKPIGYGRINVDVDSCNNVIFVEDHGVGMTPEMVKDVFLTIGGTYKELDAEDCSGGFGIAKVQFFTCAHHIYVETVRDGKKTILDTTNVDLLEGNSKLTISESKEQTGTKVKLWFPKKDERGNRINFYTWISRSYFENGFPGYPLIELNFIDRVYRWKSQPYTFNAKFNWGDVEVYMDSTSLKLNDGGRAEYKIYSAGLIQFTHSTYVGTDLGSRGYINVRPKFKAGDNWYPFSNNRDQFSPVVKSDIDKIFEKIENIMRLAKDAQLFNSLNNKQLLTYTEVNSKTKTEIVGKKFENIKIKLPENLEFEYIDLFINAFKMQFETLSKEFDLSIQNHKNHKNTISFINDRALDVNLTAVSKIGSILYDFVHDVSLCSIDKFKRIDKVGVIANESLGGLFAVHDGVSELYINPFNEVWHNANHFALKMMHFMIHEYAHALTDSKNNSHGDTFFVNENKIMDHMYSHSMYHRYYDKFVSVYIECGEEFAK